jgi:hypothetical protein
MHLAGGGATSSFRLRPSATADKSRRAAFGRVPQDEAGDEAADVASIAVAAEYLGATLPGRIFAGVSPQSLTLA